MHSVLEVFHRWRPSHEYGQGEAEGSGGSNEKEEAKGNGTERNGKEERGKVEQNSGDRLDKISDLTSSGSKFETQNGSQERNVTPNTVLSNPQQVNNNTTGSLCHGGDVGSVFDTQTPGKPLTANNRLQQVDESSGSRLSPVNNLYRSHPVLQCCSETSTTTTTTTRAHNGNSLPAKLHPEDLHEDKRKRWSVFARSVLRRSQKGLPSSTSAEAHEASASYANAPYTSSATPAEAPETISATCTNYTSTATPVNVPNTSFVTPANVPDTSRWKGILSKLSIRKVGTTILTAITQLFGQSSSSKPASTLTKTPPRKPVYPQNTTGDIVRHRKDVLRQLFVDSQGGETDNRTLSGTGKRVACGGGGEKHDTQGKVLTSKMNTNGCSESRNDDVFSHTNEEDTTNTTQDPEDDDNTEINYSEMRVRDIVIMIEDKIHGKTEATEDQTGPKPKILVDKAEGNMRPQLLLTECECADTKPSLMSAPIQKEEEISKGRDQNTNTLIPQSTSDSIENGDQTHETVNKLGDSKHQATGDTNIIENRQDKSKIDKRKDLKLEIKVIQEEDYDSDDEESEEDSDIVLRSRPRGNSVSFYRYSLLPAQGRPGQTSPRRYPVVRPRTLIIGLGVCTETKFINDSYGDGVSESESDDDEDNVSPAPAPARAPTPTRPRPATPSRTSRPHSPLSDMDIESKRNSQAVSTEPSDLEDHSSVTTSDLDCHDPPAVDSRKEKAYRIALELLHTERTYVKVLHLIDQEFQFRVDNENRAHQMFPHDVILHMFSNIKSIYKLHHDFLLPQLEERMAQWDHNRRIGDIMKNFAPFLKMYTEYVRNFDNAMTLINQWQAKCPRFATIMDDIHSMEVCGCLTLQHHMLSPVQRIPRYEMLLRDYLKKLPEDSPDCHDTEKALHLVSTAANHANDAMKKIDKFEKLLEIQESLGGAEDLVSPTRELIKEGKIIKISARSGDHQERYIFLLTDLLLLCSPRLMGSRVMSGPQYRLRAKYHVENLIIEEGDNLETANTFYIKDNNKAVELYTQTIEEKEQWLDAFIRAIHETSQRKSSLKLHFNPNQRIIDVDLGQKQPMLIRSDSVTKCMECGNQFTMVRRKHHCRACGAVVCNKCSSFKASLAYECGKSVRVCRTCHAALQELSSSTATPSPDIDDGDECSVYSAKEPMDFPFRNRGVLEVSAKTSGAVTQGFLHLKTHHKTWVKRWFALHTDFVLYSFKCEADAQALTATPVPGFTVTHLQGTRNESGISDKEKERAFKLHHAKKQYIFQAASKDESQRWMAALKKASQAELPSPVQ